MTDHVIIVGFGINGQNVAKAARYANIPYQVIEFSADIVRQEKIAGTPIIYGDAIHENILMNANLIKARVIVIAITDSYATQRIIHAIRRLSPQVYIIVRTKQINEIEDHLKIGANEVIPEEFETSIEIFTRVLNRYLIPQDQIERFIKVIRSDNYEMFRPLPDPGNHFSQALDWPDIQVFPYFISQQIDGISGKKLSESDIRNKYDLTLIGIKREKEVITKINANTVVEPGDTIYLFGNSESLANFTAAIKN